jgi:probable rRNA maturation factor
MTLEVDVQIVSEDDDLPDAAQLCAWADAAAANLHKDAELTIRIVDEHESAQLNETYRHKSGATNVLSFPFEAPPGVSLSLLGDVVICASVVKREAREQSKDSSAHWAHMVVHGVLHLLGYDHETPAESEQMEAQETRILGALGFDNPYDSRCIS